MVKLTCVSFPSPPTSLYLRLRAPIDEDLLQGAQVIRLSACSIRPDFHASRTGWQRDLQCLPVLRRLRTGLLALRLPSRSRLLLPGEDERWCLPRERREPDA